MKAILGRFVQSRGQAGVGQAGVGQSAAIRPRLWPGAFPPGSGAALPEPPLVTREPGILVVPTCRLTWRIRWHVSLKPRAWLLGSHTSPLCYPFP